MSFDLYTVYPCETMDDIRRIVGNHRDAYRELKCIYTKISLLTTALTGRSKEYAKSGHYRYGGGYQELVHKKGKGDNPYTSELIQPALKQLLGLELYRPEPDMGILPIYSFFIQFPFVLSKGYISKDDDIVYIHENPLVKDYVFKTPIVRPSSWKGNLRNAAERLADSTEKSQEMISRLFGAAKGESEEFLSEEEGRRGRLLFYPTFFDKIDLDVINPHSRKTKAGTVPIVMEVVPPGATGYFSLLYVPFDLIGDQDEDKIKAEVKSDLLCVYNAVSGMMRNFGFSAKRSKGYGLIRDELIIKDESGKKVAEGTFKVALVDSQSQNFDSFNSLKRVVEEFTNNL